MMDIKTRYHVTIEFTIGQVRDREEGLDKVWNRVLKHIRETGDEIQEFSDLIQWDQDMTFFFWSHTKKNAIRHGAAIESILKEHEFNV